MGSRPWLTTPTRLYEKVVEVRRVSDRVMTAVYFEGGMLRLICGYAPQTGISLEEKQSSYGELRCEWDVQCAGYLVMCLGDFNGHVGRHIDGFEGVMKAMALVKGICEDKFY